MNIKGLPFISFSPNEKFDKHPVVGFVRLFLAAFGISAIIILIYETTWTLFGDPTWFTHFLALIFISMVVTITALLIRKRNEEYSTRLNLMNESLVRNEKKYRMLFDNMPYGFQLNKVAFNEQGKPFDLICVEVNRNYELISLQKSADIINKTFREITPDISDEMIARYIDVAIKAIPFSSEYYSENFGKHIKVSAYSPEKNQVAILLEDITARKQVEKRQILIARVLEILNRDNDWNSSIKDLLTEIKSFSGFDAVGIRLHHDNDYPYFAQEGFSSKFISDENFLCSRFSDGSVKFDHQGKPILECTCGLLISGNLPQRPYITERGSLWTNSSKDFLEVAVDDDPRVNPRNTCIHEGYMSLLLVPLKIDGQIIGILQMNNKEPGKFNTDDIEFFEDLGHTICIAFKRMINEHAINEAGLKIQTSEEKYRRLFEEDLAGDFITNGEGIICDCNKSFLEIFGYSSKDELIGMHIKKLYADPAEYDSVILNLKKIRVLRNYETVRKNKNGDLLYLIENISASIDNDGNISEITGYFFDITDRKKSESVVREAEKTARTLLNASGSTNILINASDFTVIEINRAGSLLFGTIPESIKGRKSAELFSNVSGILNNKLREAFSEVKTVRFQEVNKGRHFYNQIYPIRAENGEVMRLAVFIQDITELHQVKELKILNSELSDLNATKDRLLSVIGHDLRSPVSGILGIAELLDQKSGTLGPVKSSAFLKSIRVTAEQVLNLLDNLLLWGKSARGQIEFNPERLKLNAIIPAITQVLLSSATNKNISIIDNTNGAECVADANMLKTILRNLVQNAIKFTNRGGWVNIDFLEGLNWVKIIVTDNGVGMDDELKKMLFEKGLTVSNPGTADEKGSGMGLLLCQEFAERHSGTLTVESQPNKGSRFFLTLPKKS